MVTQYLMFDTNFQYCIKLILTCCTSAKQKQEFICFGQIGCNKSREGNAEDLSKDIKRYQKRVLKTPKTA